MDIVSALHASFGDKLVPLIILASLFWLLLIAGGLFVPVGALLECHKRRAELKWASTVWSLAILLTWTIAAVPYGLFASHSRRLRWLSIVTLVLFAAEIAGGISMAPFFRAQYDLVQRSMTTTSMDNLSGFDRQLIERELGTSSLSTDMPVSRRNLKDVLKSLLKGGKYLEEQGKY